MCSFFRVRIIAHLWAILFNILFNKDYLKSFVQCYKPFTALQMSDVQLLLWQKKLWDIITRHRCMFQVGFNQKCRNPQELLITCLSIEDVLESPSVNQYMIKTLTSGTRRRRQMWMFFFDCCMLSILQVILIFYSALKLIF